MARALPWLLLALAACGGAGDAAKSTDTAGGWSSSGGEAPSDAADVDADTDADADTDTDADTDADSDADADTDADTDSDTDTDTDADDTGTVDTGAPIDCDTDTPITLYLSPDDSNSMSSPVLAREGGGAHIPPIRTYEFFNYYTFDYPTPPPGELTVTVELAVDHDAAPGEYVLQIGVASEARTNAEREPMTMTLVMDTSCSMAGPPIELSRAMCRTIAGKLGVGDTVSMVTWSDSQDAQLDGHAITGRNDPALIAECDALTNGGGTDLSAGLERGYAMAERHASLSRLDRLVLVSDGGANMGVTDESLIARHSEAGDESGIYLAGIGVAEARNYNDELMDAVTDAGKGAAVFIPDEAEIEAILDARFVNTFDVAARNVKLRLDLPPGFEIVRSSAEEISADPRAVDAQHLAPNDAMVFHNRIATCDPAGLSDDDVITATVMWQDDRGELRELQGEARFGDLLGLDHGNLRKGLAVFDYAEALAAWRRDDPRRAEAVAWAIRRIDEAKALLPRDAELDEMRDVLTGL